MTKPGPIIPAIAERAEPHSLTLLARQQLDGVPDSVMDAGAVLGPPPRTALVALGREMERQRRLRRAFLPRATLGETAFDILLRLYDDETGTSSVAALSEALNVPFKSCARWIAYLESVGHLQRVLDLPEANGTAALTDFGRTAIEAYLRECLRTTAR